MHFSVEAIILLTRRFQSRGLMLNIHCQLRQIAPGRATHVEYFKILYSSPITLGVIRKPSLPQILKIS